MAHLTYHIGKLLSAYVLCFGLMGSIGCIALMFTSSEEAISLALTNSVL